MSTSIPPLLFSKLFPLPSGTTQIFRHRNNVRPSSTEDDDDESTTSTSSSSSSTTRSNSSSSSNSSVSSKKKNKPTRQKTRHNMFGKNALCFLDAEFGACFTLSHNNGTNNCATTFPLLIAPPTNINAVESMNEDGGNCFLSLSTEVIHQKKPATSNNKNVPNMITTKIIAPHCFLSKPQPQKSHFQNNNNNNNNNNGMFDGEHNNNNNNINASSSSGGGSVGASSWKEVTSMETKAFALGSILADKGEEYCDHLDLLQENGIRHYLSGMNDDEDDDDRAHESDTDDTDDGDEQEEEEEISEEAEESANQEVEKISQTKRNSNKKQKNAASSSRKQRRRLLVADNTKEIIQNWISADGSRICCLVKCQVPFYSPLYRFHRDQSSKQTKPCANKSKEQREESFDENKHHHECASAENEHNDENDPHFSYLLFFDAFPCKSAGCGWYLSAVCKLPNLFPKHQNDSKHLQIRKTSSASANNNNKQQHQEETIFAYCSFTGGFITPNIFVFGWTAHCINISFAQNRFDVSAKIFRYDPPKEEIHVSATATTTTSMRSMTPTRKSSSHESHTDVFIRNAAALRTLVAASRRSAYDYVKKNLSLISSTPSSSSSAIENEGNEKQQHDNNSNNPLFRVTSWWNISAASAMTDRDASQIFIFSLDDVRYLILPQTEHQRSQSSSSSSSTGGVDVHAPIFLHLKISSNKNDINDIISQSVKGLSLLAAESSTNTTSTQQQQQQQNQNTHKPTSVVAAANQKQHSRQIVSQLLLSKIPPTPPSYFLRTQRHSTILDNSVVYESGATSAFASAANNTTNNNSGLQNNYRNALFDATAATSSSSNQSFVSSSTSVSFHCGIVPKSSHTPLPLHPTANRRIERIFSSGNWMTSNNAEQFFTNCGQSNNNNNNNGSSSDDNNNNNNSALTTPGAINQGNNNASTGNVLTNFFSSLASGGSGGSGSNAPSNNLNFFHGSENNNNISNNNNTGSSGTSTTMNGSIPTTSPAALLLAQNNEQSPSYSLIWETFLPPPSSTSNNNNNNGTDQQSTFASNSSSSSNANNNNNNNNSNSSSGSSTSPSSLPAILNCLFPSTFGVRLHLHIAGKKPMTISRENIPSFYSSAVATTVTAPYQVAMSQQHAAIVGDNVVPGIDCLVDLFKNGPNRVLNVALVEENRIRIAYLSYHTQPHDQQQGQSQKVSASLFDKNQENNNNNNNDFLTSRSSSSTSSSGFTSASRSGGMLNNALNKYHTNNNRGSNNGNNNNNNNAKSTSPLNNNQKSSFRNNNNKNNNCNNCDSVIKLNIIEVTFIPTGFFTRNKEVPAVALYSVQLPGSFSVPSFFSCSTNQNTKRDEDNTNKKDLDYLQQIGLSEYFSSLSHVEQQVMNLKNVLSASPSLFYPPPPLGSSSASSEYSSSFSFLHQWNSSTSCCSVGMLSDGNSLMVSQIPERIQ